MSKTINDESYGEPVFDYLVHHSIESYEAKETNSDRKKVNEQNDEHRHDSRQKNVPKKTERTHPHEKYELTMSENAS